MRRNFFTRLVLEGEGLLDKNDFTIRAWFALVGGFTEVERHLRRVIARQGLNLPRFDILMLLSRQPGGVSMGNLARDLVVTKGNVTGVVKRLESDGLIERVVDKNDRRIQTVKLTERGREAFDDHYSVYAESVSGALGHLSAEELHQLTNIMAKIDADLLKEVGVYD